MLLDKFKFSFDLCDVAIDEVIASMREKSDLTLVVSVSDIAYNTKPHHAITKIQLNTSLPDGAWYIHGDYHGIYSPGA